MSVLNKACVLQTIQQIPQPFIDNAYTMRVYNDGITLQIRYNSDIVRDYISQKQNNITFDSNGYLMFTIQINGIPVIVTMT